LHCDRINYSIINDSKVFVNDSLLNVKVLVDGALFNLRFPADGLQFNLRFSAVRVGFESFGLEQFHLYLEHFYDVLDYIGEGTDLVPQTTNSVILEIISLNSCQRHEKHFEANQYVLN